MVKNLGFEVRNIWVQNQLPLLIVHAQVNQLLQFPRYKWKLIKSTYFIGLHEKIHMTHLMWHMTRVIRTY